MQQHGGTFPQDRRPSGGSGRLRVGVAAAVGVGALSLLLAACGSSSPSSTTTAPSGSSSTSAPSGSSSSTTSKSSGLSSELSTIESKVGDESKKTFTLTYASTENGQTQTVTLAQSPPKYVFKTSNGEILYNGSKVYYCSLGSTTTCLSYGSASSSPLGSMIGLFTGTTALTTMKSWSELIGTAVTGYHLSIGSSTYAGQPSKCATWSYQGQKATYCVTDSGVLAYAGTSSGNFKLTGYSASASASTFSLPKGATITTLPSGA